MAGLRRRGWIGVCVLAVMSAEGASWAQQPQPWFPPQPQTAPQQPAPYPPQQPAPYPPQQPAPYPPQPAPYPPQQPAPYPPQPAPYPQQQPYPQRPAPYGQPPPYGQPGYAQQPTPPAPPPPAADSKRGAGEMTFLYGTSIAYGVGSGVWLDALAKASDPGLAFIAPLALGAAMPIGVYFWDDHSPLHRGVPASIATGLTLGAVEGIAISGTQWTYTHDKGNDWGFQTQTTMTWVFATGGGVGGFFFGEWLRPDPRSLGFIASGAGWGAVTGALFGAGIVGSEWKDGASVAGLIGYNAGILATGALSTVYTPSWNAQKWMWIGYGAGVAAGLVVYPFYLASDAPVRHGLVANAIGGVAGLALAAAFTAGMTDDGAAAKTSVFTPPFQIGFAPTAKGGAVVSAYGQF